MSNSTMLCPNCGCELDFNATICDQCNLVVASNLENFLVQRYKLLTIIGIFGALSVYLSTTSSTQGGNDFLQIGSYISLAIVILLSGLWGWELIKYSSKILQFPFDKKTHYRIWFKLGFRFSLIALFIAFFVGVIGSISLFILSNRTIAEQLIWGIFFAFILLMIISTIYFPYRSAIESSGIKRRFFWLFLLISFFFFSIGYLREITTIEWQTITLTIFFVVPMFFLIIRTSLLIYQGMNDGTRSLTIDNLRKIVRIIWKR